MFDDGEAEARSTLLTASAFIDAVEAFEEPRNVFIFNSVALIFYRKNRFARFGIGVDGDRAARFTVFHGVADEIDERLFDDRGVDDGA